MLTTLFPRAFHKHSTLPLLGSMADDFDDWLVEQGYAVNSRIYAIEMLHHIDQDLRRRGIKHVSSLSRPALHRSWRALIQQFPRQAGTVRVLEKYLNAHSLLNSAAERRSGIDVYVSSYATYLQEIRGLAEATICNHIRTAKYFLTHLGKKSRRPQALNSGDLEEYIKKAGKRRSRAGLQNEVAALRSFLRFLAAQGKIPPGLDTGIDTPRVYRLEQLPRSLPWETVRAFLRSIDRTTDKGLRDYTIFVLIATYGLRVREVVSLTLDDIQWRSNQIRIPHCKRSTPLELPITNEVATTLYKYLKRVPPATPHRHLFLRMRAPIGPLSSISVSTAFRTWSRRSGLSIPFEGAHCLRHAYAVNLLRNSTSLKTIGDILGHRSAESTGVYLRLGMDDLRDVSLPAPAKREEVQR